MTDELFQKVVAVGPFFMGTVSEWWTCPHRHRSRKAAEDCAYRMLVDLRAQRQGPVIIPLVAPPPKEKKTVKK